MADYNQQAPRPKTILNHRSLTMFAPNGEGGWASLAIDFKKNDVSMIVRTNIAADANNDYGRIAAQVPPQMFFSVLEMIKEVANATVPCRFAYEHKDKKFIGQGKMTDGPVLLYRIIVGRGDDGVVYISVVQEKRPNIKFSFLLDQKSTFKDGEGNEMPKALESKFLALGRVSTIEKLLPAILSANYKHPEPKQQGGGGGGYNNNRGGQGGGGSYGGGGSNSSGGATMSSDDIPW